MGFGLTNSPATYQRLMEDCLGDLHFDICMIFIDDRIIFSDTYEEHVCRLKTVFQRLQENGLKPSPKKCTFFQVRYLGTVSGDGMKPDPSKVDKVLKWSTPESPEQARQFLGFAGYYRKFIQNFTKICRSLTNLLPQIGKAGRNKMTKVKPEVQWNWGPDQQNAFEELKTALTTQPVLGYPDYTLPFELHTDACQQGLGAVLYQEQQDGKRVIAYASRVLSKTERNYPAHKLDFLALKWAVTEKCHDYLYGHQFTVLTDNNPLTYVLTSALSLVRVTFYFPGMAKAVDAWINACDRCLRRKSPTNARAPLVNIRTTQPLELHVWNP